MDSSGSIANSLSSHELFQLLHAPQQPEPQQPLVDSYGVPLVQQPQLQQHFHQQAALFPPSVILKQEVPSEPVQNNLLVFKKEFSPEYQTFNYEEQYQGGSRQQDNYRGNYQEPEESENAPSVTVIRKTPESTVTSFEGEFETQKDYEQKASSVTEEDSYYDNTATKVDDGNIQEDYEENNEASPYYSEVDGGNSAIATSYYTTLPNREAAETLATLAAAGNINSNLVHHIRNGENEDTAPARGDAPVEEDYADEETGDEELPPQVSKPVNLQRPKEAEVQQTTRLSSEQRQRHPVIPPPPQPEEDIQEDPEYVDYSADVDQQGSKHSQGATGNLESQNKHQHKEDVKSTNTNLQFGERIRPKRNK